MVIIPILIYTLMLLILFIFKPSIMFDTHGNIKTYNSKSLLTIDIVYPILAVFAFYLYLLLKITLIKK